MTAHAVRRRQRPRWLERHWRPAIMLALVGLAVAGGWAIRASQRNALDAIHASQIRACERGNLLRREAQINVQVLDALLLTEAAHARHIQALVADNRLERVTSERTAIRYEHLRDVTRPVPEVDCAAVIPRP